MAEAIALALLGSIGVTGTAAVAITTAVIGAAISIGASLVAQMLMPKPEMTPSDRQNLVKLPIMPRVRHYGRVRVGGARVFEQARAGILYRVTAHGHGEIDAIEEHLIQDEVLTLNPSGGVTTPAKWAGLITVSTRNGVPAPAHYTTLESAFADWDSTHTGKGVQSSLVTMAQVEQEVYLDFYPNGINTSYKQTLRGARVWDPRDPAQSKDDAATWQWSDNAILIALDHFRHETGFGLPDEWITPELDSWKAAADAADETVALKYGGTEPRYRASGSYSFDERPADVGQRILAASNARVWVGASGGIACSAGVWSAPTVVIDDAAIESYQIGAGNEGPDVVNAVSAVFTDPLRDFTETQCQAWTDAGSVARFGVKRSPPAPLYMVPSNGQCRRLMKQALAQLSPAWRGRIVTNLRGLPALSERFIRIEIGELGLSFTAEIADVQFVIEQGTVVRGVSIEFISMDAATFAWNAAAEEGDQFPVPPTIGTSDVPQVAGFGVVKTAPTATASWSAYASPAYQASIEFRVNGTIPWLLAPVPATGATSLVISGLTAGTTYQFRARTLTGSRSSAYSSIVNLTM